jgi:hypothetical protein
VASCRKTSRGVTDGVRGEGDRIRGKRRVNIGRFRQRNRIRMCRKTLTTGSFYVHRTLLSIQSADTGLFYLRRIEKFTTCSTGYSI